MALPAEMPTVTVTGKWEHSHAGEPVAGSLLFTADVPYLNDVISNIQFVPDDVTATLDGSGAFSVQLLPGNLDAVAQKNWEWRCTTTLTGIPAAHVPAPFTFGIDKDAGTVQFASVVPLNAAPGAQAVYVVTGPTGPQGATGGTTDVSFEAANRIAADALKIDKARMPAIAADASGVDNTGATDTGTALQTFIDGLAGTEQVARLYGTFKHAATIVFKGHVDASGATFNYTGSGTAVQIGAGGSAVRLDRVTIHLPKIINTTKPGTGWTASTVGCKVINLNSSFVWVPYIVGFETGLLVYGQDQGTVYSQFFLGQLDNNKRNLMLDATVGGWVNQNNYYGGRFSHNSGEGSLVSGTRHILLTDTPTTTFNNNNFYGPSLESPGVVQTVIDVQGGVANLWDKARFEWSGTGGPTVHWGPDAVHNRIRDSHHGDLITETFDAGAARNDIDADTWSRHTVGTTKGWVMENNFSTTAQTISGLRAGGTVAGDDPVTDYAWRGSASNWGFKRHGDAFDRVLVDGTNGQVLVGTGTATPTTVLTGAGGGVLFARKTSDEARANNTLTADADLKVTPAINTTYVIDCTLFYDGGSTGDFRAELTVPAGATLTFGTIALATAASTSLNTIDVRAINAATAAPGGAVSGTKTTWRARGLLRMGSTAGNLTVVWAQNTTDATAANLYTDSFLTATQVA